MIVTICDASNFTTHSYAVLEMYGRVITNITMSNFNYRDISFQLSRYFISIIAIFQFNYRDN